MGLWATIGKLTVAIVLIGGVVAYGTGYSASDLPVDGPDESSSTTTPTPAEETEDPVVGGGAETATPSPTPLADVDEESTSSFDRDALETTIHSEINDYLEGTEADTVSWEPLTRDAARRHAQAMADAQEVSLDVGGATATERVNEEMTCDPGVTLARVDSVTSTSSTAQDIVDEWASTERTRSAMTDDFHDGASVGAAQGTDGRVYVVAVFC